MDVVSGFLLAEQYAKHRDEDTWNQVLREATQGLSVEIVQQVSDEAKALIAHARSLGAHHSPDLFHVQQELSKATSVSLASQTRHAEKACQQAIADSASCEAFVQEAEQQFQKARSRQEQADQARHDISEAYHPFDLSTGQARDVEHVEQQLQEPLERLKQIAQEAGLSAACHERIAKAGRVLPLMVATIAFFWKLVRPQLAELCLSVELERNLLDHVLPAEYLQLAAAKARTAEQRDQIQEVAQRLNDLARDGPWGQLTAPEQLKLQAVARIWAEWFQRSSSCVEGRNSHLSRWHHGLHRLSDERLSRHCERCTITTSSGWTARALPSDFSVPRQTICWSGFWRACLIPHAA